MHIIMIAVILAAAYALNHRMKPTLLRSDDDGPGEFYILFADGEEIRLEAESFAAAAEIAHSIGNVASMDYMDCLNTPRGRRLQSGTELGLY